VSPEFQCRKHRLKDSHAALTFGDRILPVVELEYHPRPPTVKWGYCLGRLKNEGIGFFSKAYDGEPCLRCSIYFVDKEEVRKWFDVLKHTGEVIIVVKHMATGRADVIYLVIGLERVREVAEDIGWV